MNNRLIDSYLDGLISGEFDRMPVEQRVRYRAEILEHIDVLISKVENVYRLNRRHRDFFAKTAVLIAGNDSGLASRLYELDEKENRLSSGMRLRQLMFRSRCGHLAESLELVEDLYSKDSSIKDAYAKIADEHYGLKREFSKLDEFLEMDRTAGRSGDWGKYYIARDSILNGRTTDGIKFLRNTETRGLLTKLGQFLMNIWLLPQAAQALEAESRPSPDTSLYRAHVDWMLAKIESLIAGFPKTDSELIRSQWEDIVLNPNPSRRHFRVFNSEIAAPSFFDAAHLFHEVALFQPYRFLSENPNPVIVDGGSNCGFSISYFKYLYPDSRIAAVEPDPRNITMLKENAARNDWTDTNLIKAAISAKRSDSLQLIAQEGHSMNSSVLEGFSTSSNELEKYVTKSITAADLIDGPIDFLKLDIEGAEAEVMESLVGEMKWIKSGFIEYHYRQGRLGSRNKLEKILDALNRGNKRYALLSPIDRIPKLYDEEKFEPGKRWSLGIRFAS